MTVLNIKEEAATETASPVRAAPRGQALSARGLSHFFGTTQVLDNVSFDVEAGEVAALLGPSGCGKTTALRIVAGLIKSRAGSVELGGSQLDNLPTRHRRIGMVFQNYALFPHMTVRENIGYGLVSLKLPRPERRERVSRMMSMVRLDALGDRLPRELSGGQQQRAAVARALAIQPRLLLLDEPFGALDKDLRLDLQIELRRLQRELAITTIIVTHDQEEALSVADRVIVMRNGRIEQMGTPIGVYDRPRNLFVNQFVGRSSTLRGTFEGAESGNAIVALSTGDRLMFPRPLNFLRGAAVAICVRPEHVCLTGAKAVGALAATLTVSLPLGSSVVHEVILSDGTPVKIAEPRLTGAPLASTGAQVAIQIDLVRAQVFPAAEAIGAIHH